MVVQWLMAANLSSHASASSCAVMVLIDTLPDSPAPSFIDRYLFMMLPQRPQLINYQLWKL